MSIPVAAVSELYTELNINELDHIVGAGLTPNIPKVLVDRIHAGYPAGTVTSVRSYAFGVSYQYDDIFGDKSNTLTGAFVYVDNTRFQANEAVQGDALKQMLTLALYQWHLKDLSWPNPASLEH
ncbi:hypothetical protein HORIV_35000 [Vreelandella olivaria]|uniref:Uncharacterized protein n=1 Tax=Vreelandella olivaria TaxID=390919 RepID=A0ABN5WVV0_9GAMM|nr:hypothetical protein HORIV_35000 [Halomonas olivaria]